MDNAVVTPRLPKPPQSAQPLATAGGVGQTLRTCAQFGAYIFTSTPWEHMVWTSGADERLKSFEPKVHKPEGSQAALWGSTDFTLYNLKYDSQWVYRRLAHVVQEVTRALNADGVSVTLEEIATAMKRIGPHILWDSFLDLLLADSLLNERRYEHGWLSLLPRRVAPELIKEVAELRGRVLYVINGLSLIYAQSLRGDAVTRLHQSATRLPELEEVAGYFSCYIEAVNEVDGAHPQKPWPLSLFSRST